MLKCLFYIFRVHNVVLLTFSNSSGNVRNLSLSWTRTRSLAATASYSDSSNLMASCSFLSTSSFLAFSSVSMILLLLGTKTGTVVSAQICVCRVCDKESECVMSE